METNRKQKKYLCQTCETEKCRECEEEKRIKGTRKMVGKSFFDVGKYVLTAAIITTFLGGMQEMWKVYVAGGVIAIVAFGLGYYFMNVKN